MLLWYMQGRYKLGKINYVSLVPLWRNPSNQIFAKTVPSKFCIFFYLNSIIMNIIWIYSKMLAIERQYILENEKKIMANLFLVYDNFSKKIWKIHIWNIVSKKEMVKKKKKDMKRFLNFVSNEIVINTLELLSNISIHNPLCVLSILCVFHSVLI